MKLVYNEHSLKSGIYKIINTHTNRTYIGQAKEFKARWNGHRRSLLIGKHQNKFLQHDFNKSLAQLGHDDFLEFHVLEVMVGSTKEERNKREEEVIALHFDKQDLCYNFKQRVDGKERTKFSNNPGETRQLISETQKKLWMDPDERRKRIEGSDGQRRDRIGKAAKRVWAELPLEEQEKKRLQFLEAARVSRTIPELEEKRLTALRANSWKVSAAQKWKAENDSAFRARLVAQGQAAAKTYFMINPEGQSITIHNMTKFCRENNLTKQCMLRVCKGLDPAHKGWRVQPKESHE